MRDFKLLVFANPVPSREAEFYPWFDLHAREVVDNVEFLSSVQMYESVNEGWADPPYSRLLICDWHAEDLASSWARLREFLPAAESGGLFTPPPEGCEPSTRPHYFYQPIGPRLQKARSV